MSNSKKPNYWVFSNKIKGTYGDSIWDMSTILKTGQYSIAKSESNRTHVKADDIVFMRIYGDSYIGRFRVKDEWRDLLDPEEKSAGVFAMTEVEIWKRPIPQGLVINDLSNHDIRHRIISIKYEDCTIIETSHKLFDRLQLGGEDKNIIILEKGLEEVLKQNLDQVELTLANEDIQQQFYMGIDIGRSDLICMDRNGDLCVIELKRGMASDQAIGQVLRYIGWINENIAKEKQNVYGMIVARDFDEHLRLAASEAGIKLLRVRV